MKKNKFSFKWNALALFPLIAIVLLFIFFIYHFLALANPDAFNPEPNNLGNNDYLFTMGNAISVTFAAILFFYCILLSLDLLFRKDSSHILLVLVGEAIISAYAIAKTVWTFDTSFKRQVISLVFLITADVLLIVMHYFFLKKAWDGDYDSIYMICLLLAGIALYFGLVQYDSVLDAYSYLGDIVFWGDWSVAHLMVALYVGLSFINIHSDYDPEPLQLDESHVDLSKGN